MDIRPASLVSVQPANSGTASRWSPERLGEMDLFGSQPSIAPGFRYEPDRISHAAQIALIREIKELPLEAFDFHGFKANRRVISFGWRYDFVSGRLALTDPIPEWLLPLREEVAYFAEGDPEDFAQVLVSEYAPGAGIGWHKDKAVFGRVVGVSLGAACPLRMRKAADNGEWLRAQQEISPRSMYLLDGEVRTEWEHSIAPVALLRYSLTFRTLKA